jgi:hypothetical protein
MSARPPNERPQARAYPSSVACQDGEEHRFVLPPCARAVASSSAPSRLCQSLALPLTNCAPDSARSNCRRWLGHRARGARDGGTRARLVRGSVDRARPCRCSECHRAARQRGERLQGYTGAALARCLQARWRALEEPDQRARTPGRGRAGVRADQPATGALPRADPRRQAFGPGVSSPEPAMHGAGLRPDRDRVRCAARALGLPRAARGKHDPP